MMEPPYLAPYLRAARDFGGGFQSLLWASPMTQAIRFDALRRIQPLDDRSLLDVGCGRADLLEFLVAKRVRLADYVGIEAVEPLAVAAERKVSALPVPARIIRADFVREPVRMFAGADVVIFSGSMNTATDDVFYETLRRAYDAAAEALVFNFLASPVLAGTGYLVWRRPDDVLRFARQLSPAVTLRDNYLDGDCTIAIQKAPEENAAGGPS